MTLDASGNLLVGATSASGNSKGYFYANADAAHNLKVTNASAGSSAYAALVISNDVSNTLEFGMQSSTRSATYPAGEGWIYAGNGVNIGYVGSTKFYAGNAERARIDSSGNLLVGTTSASHDTITNGLAVVGTGAVTAIGIGHVTGSGSGTNYASFNYAGTKIGSITQNGTTAVAYNTSSDYRLKNTIAPMTGALAKVAALKPVTYKWKADGSDGEGFIAHELQAICPDAVTGQKDAVDAEGKPVYQGIDTSFLVATLTAAIQEQQAIIEQLKADVAALKGTQP
jgi:hypothetical protein